jgi:hypothetical protein
MFNIFNSLATFLAGCYSVPLLEQKFLVESKHGIAEIARHRR